MAGLGVPKSVPVPLNFGFEGKRLLQRTAAGFIAPLWQNQEERIKALATAQGESQLYVGAWHDNHTELRHCDVGQVVRNPELGQAMTVLNPATGKVRLDDGTVENHPPESLVTTSRDCGPMQINISAEQIGTESEAKIRTDSLDPEIYEPAVKANFERARRLYDTPWPVHEKRLWQPWVAYTTGWAMLNVWFVWKHQKNEQGVVVPVGPWVPTGRYLQKSIMGWANWYIAEGLKKPEDAAFWAKSKQKLYKIEGELGVRNDWVSWTSRPLKPQDPPADGVGPRPKPNNGK